MVALLRCSRYSLGIMASSRGAIAGRLLLQVYICIVILFMNANCGDTNLYGKLSESSYNAHPTFMTCYSESPNTVVLCLDQNGLSITREASFQLKGLSMKSKMFFNSTVCLLTTFI